jgi:RNA polymerase sigma-70 factor (ECF subfamily)
MDRYRNGDAMAFEILYRRYAPQVIGYLTKKCRSEKLAQDLAQEVFMKLHRSKHQYLQALPFAPWLFSITRSVFLDSAKKRSLEDTIGPEKFDQMSSPEEKDSEKMDLGSLPEFQKQAVAMRIYDEATFEEIAVKLSTSPENARQLFSRGLKNLKSAFAKGGSK